MLRENLTGGSENPSLTALTEKQVDILRLLGKGNSLGGIFQQLVDQNSKINVKRELRNAYQIFGVTGGTAAVVSALDNGFLQTRELIERDFDWSLFNDLTPVQISILEAFTHAKGENLNEEESSRLDITTSQDQKDYIWHSITAIEDKLGLNSKREAVIYYYAFRERQQRGENSSAAEKPLLTNRQRLILVMLSRGRNWTEIGKSFENPIRGDSVKNHYMPKIYAKLGVANVDEAVNRAREMGILKS